ncbi:MAG: transposase [Frankiaceae bacterium]
MLSCPVPWFVGWAARCGPGSPNDGAYVSTGGDSNGPVEATNLDIETSRRIASGFRNYFRNYRLRQLLAYGYTWQTSWTPRIRGNYPVIVAQSRIS